MDRKRWDRIEQLLSEALKRSESERRSFLKSECAGDDALMNELLGLLASHSEDSSFLRDPLDLPDILSTEEVSAGEDRTVGPYRLVRRLGRGGMGEVWLATREAEAFHQRVALKLMRPGPKMVDLAARFRLERQILAGLNHPYIAHLLDAGATDGGVPYLAMEYVEGLPVTRYCEVNGLDLRDRLELFLDVCRAVQHAHQNLVVHRDLKPANILVTAEGTPKLLDFGIAKLLAPGLIGPAGHLTRAGIGFMTPDYAAPEQVRGEPVTTATDVYALGMILYELVSGHRAHDLSSLPQAEVVRVICDEDPPGPACHRSSIDAELDNLVLKAIRKEPARRYSTAEALARDVSNYLEGRPVEARGDAWTYRFRKMVGRHRGAVAAVLTIALLLIAGTVVAWQQATRIQAQATAIEMERDKAREVSDFLTGLFEAADPAETRGEETTVGELLDQGAARLDTALVGQPEVRGEILGVLGYVYWTLGRYDRAEELAEQAVNTLRDSEAGDSLLARNLDLWGTLLADQGRLGQAADKYAEALEIRRDLFGPSNPEVAVTLGNLAMLKWDLGQLEEAERLARQALEVKRTAVPSDTAIAGELGLLGGIVSARGNYAEAESLLAMGYRLNREHRGEDHPYSLTSLNNLAALYTRQGRYDEAVSHYRELLRFDGRVHGDDHPTVTDGLQNLATSLYGLADYEEAETILRQVVERREREFDEVHPYQASALVWLARVLQQRGTDRWSEAEEVYRQGLAIQRRTLGDEHPSTARTLGLLGSLLAAMGDDSGAQRHIVEALRVQRESLGESHPITAMTMLELGRLALQRMDLETAGPLVRNVVRTLSTSLPENHPGYADALLALGELERLRGEPRAAEEALRRALEIRRLRLGSGDWRTAEVGLRLAVPLIELGDTTAARELLDPAERVLREERGAEDPLAREAHDLLSQLP